MLRFLFAWDHRANTHHRVALPSPVVRCRTEETRVVTITSNKQVHIWEFGGTLSPVDLGPLLDTLDLSQNAKLHWHKNLDIIVHPRKPDTIFLTTVYPASPSQGPLSLLTWGVYEFRDRQHIKSYETTITASYDATIQPSLDTGIEVCSKAQKSDSYGRYCIGLYQIDALEWNMDLFRSTLRNDHIGLVEFDIYHATFDHRFYALPTFLGKRESRAYLRHFLNICHPWNNRLAAQIVFHLSAPELFNLEGIVVVLVPLENSDSSALHPPGAGLDVRLRDNMSYWFEPISQPHRERVMVDLNIEYCLQTPSLTFCTKLMGDDDFLVSFADDGFVAWSFDTVLNSCPSDQRLVEDVGISRFMRNPANFAPCHDRIQVSYSAGAEGEGQ